MVESPKNKSDHSPTQKRNLASISCFPSENISKSSQMFHIFIPYLPMKKINHHFWCHFLAPSGGHVVAPKFPPRGDQALQFLPLRDPAPRDPLALLPSLRLQRLWEVLPGESGPVKREQKSETHGCGREFVRFAGIRRIIRIYKVLYISGINSLVVV